jgi:hypothetical protein
MKNIESIMNVLKTAKVSIDDYDSSKVPFFNNNNKYDFEIGVQIDEKVPDGLNRNVKLIYDILGNSKKEIYINDWIIMSLENAMEIYDSYCNEGQKNVFDIGYYYLGMGHINIIACDLTTHLLFYHRGGGSNGYDRINSFNDIVQNGSNNTSQCYFKDWFYKM